MHQYELIDKKWIVSANARRVYRVASAVSLTLYVSLIGVLLSGPTPFWKQILFLGVLGTALNGTAMEIFLFRYDGSSAIKQIFWFIAMLFIPLGPALYCYIVYSRSRVLRSVCAVAEEEVLKSPKPIG